MSWLLNLFYTKPKDGPSRTDDSRGFQADLQEYLDKLPPIFHKLRNKTQGENIDDTIRTSDNKSSTDLSGYVDSFNFEDNPDIDMISKRKTFSLNKVSM